MGKTCVVPKCKSGYRSCKEKVSLFSIPKHRLESWQEVIPRTDRKLTCRDNICEKHFRKKDIIREIKTPIFSYALKVPKLAPNATPTKFPTCPKYEFRPRPKKENEKFTKINRRQRQESITNHEIDNRSKFMKKLMEDRQLFPRFGTFNKVEYDKLIDEVLKSKWFGNDIYRKEFDVVHIGRVKKLTAPIKKSGEIKFYVPDEDMFDVIHEAHQSMNHTGHQSMFKELQKSFKNVTNRDILIYLNLCCSCSSHTFEKVGSVEKKSVINYSSFSYASKNTKLVKESVFGYNSFSSKCDINIIDYQTNPDGDYKFILVYQNHLTKFCMLKALKSLTVDEIYYNLCDIFAFIGVPKIINSEICDESLNEVIKKIRKRLPELLIQHIKSKGNIELAERVTEGVEAWMKRKSTNTWNEALRFIQLSINKDLDEKLNRIPFETVFGMPTFEEEPTKNFIKTEPIDQNATVLAKSSIKQEPIDHDENCIKEEPIMYQDLVLKEENVEIVSNICDVCENDMGSEEGCSRCEDQMVMKSESHNQSTQDKHWPSN